MMARHQGQDQLYEHNGPLIAVMAAFMLAAVAINSLVVGNSGGLRLGRALVAIPFCSGELFQ
jgi:ABC-type Co2+ transport system permease subunit